MRSAGEDRKWVAFQRLKALLQPDFIFDRRAPEVCTFDPDKD